MFHLVSGSTNQVGLGVTEKSYDDAARRTGVTLWSVHFKSTAMLVVAFDFPFVLPCENLSPKSLSCMSSSLQLTYMYEDLISFCVSC